jgi:hypothetical protein
MKKLLLKVLMLFLYVVISVLVIILIPVSPDEYNQSIIDKHNRLDNTEAPRIILAGGSNLAFGIDSGAIQNAFGIPVINVAIHASFGLGRILDDLSPYLQAKDILVIAPEYAHFENLWNGDSTAYELIFNGKQYRLAMHPPFYGLPSDFTAYLTNNILARIPRPPNPLVYTRDGFNEYGDYIKHLGMENQTFASSGSIKQINPRYLGQFLRLVDVIAKGGVTVIVSYPSYEASLFEAGESAIRELDTAFRTHGGITVISRPEDYAFPREYFYDTSYHLNAKGRELRTALLIRDLGAYWEE